MYQRAQSIYYFLSVFALGAALFVMQPAQTPEVAVLQEDIMSQVNIAWQQSIGDQPWLEDFIFIFDTVNEFYNLAADATIAMFAQPEVDQDIIYVFSQVYLSFAQAFNPNYQDPNVIAYHQIEIPPPPINFMSAEPIYNIVPYREVVRTIEPGVVSGNFTMLNEPANSSLPWVTLKDNMTGQLYCLAIYNGNVNQYLGPCKYDYH